MILYFADRHMNIHGTASTELPDGLQVVDDLKIEDVETGVASFEAYIPYDDSTREQVEMCTAVGNYILRSHENENEFYTIIESETDTKNQEVYIYAEDAGLDLLNDVVGVYTADKAYNIAHYINLFTYDSGFEIGVNEASDLTRKLSWDGDATAAERIASVATQFDNCEVSYSFEVKGLEVVHKYINIHKKRGKDVGVQLRLNQEVDRIITKKSIANLATALEVTGGTPEDSETPITLNGYSYDDGDFYVKNGRLYSREAVKKWSRYIWNKEPNQISGEDGHIVKQYSYDTLSQSTLCARAITKLKRIREIEMNFECDISVFPENTQVGDTVNLIDDQGGLYLSTRFLKLETSVYNNEHKATLGEYLLKGSGISQKVEELASQFAETALSAKRAQMIADTAKATADAAKSTANTALTESENAITKANEATAAAETATQSSAAAQMAAEAAEKKVTQVQESVSGIEKTVDDAHEAAQNAYKAAETAETKAAEAHTASQNAVTKANEAAASAETAKTNAETAISKAETASGTASVAKETADTAKATAEAAKEDAKQAEKDIDKLGESLTTLSNTMSADYARKTDLTEASANLQTQITQNAGQIASTATKVQTIDETANNAQELAQSANSAAALAKEQADTATADAAKAQKAADASNAAAVAAQAEADKAKAAAETAQSVADKANTDLTNAKNDLATVQGRVDATEEDISKAQAAVDAAQKAADKANEDAQTASSKAAAAQSTANTAVSNAAAAQETANDAVSKATLAQAAADAAKGDAKKAQETADAAKTAAVTAQQTADTAKSNAATAQTKANAAADAAATAQGAADAAASKAAQAQKDLDAAEANLAAVTGRVGATEAEVEAAKSAVATAQTAADKAKSDAAAAQTTANTAKNNAANAQTAADNAKKAADKAQADADTAQKAADDAQAAVDALAVRVTSAETSIKQNAEEIALRAKKSEVTETLGGYYTKEEADAKLSVKADEISANVSKTYATKTSLETTDKKANDANTAANNAQITANSAIGNAETANRKANAGVNTVTTLFYASNSTTAPAKPTVHVTTNNADAKKTWNIALPTYAENYKYYYTCQETLTNGGAYAWSAVTQTTHNSALEAAQNVANTANNNAVNARSTADTAKANAATAQTAADNAKSAADKAQGDVNALTTRVSTAETSIKQNADAIALRATKTEVDTKLGGYYTKAQTDSAIKVSADGIISSVSSDITNKVNGIEVGGKNLLLGTSCEWYTASTSYNYNVISVIDGSRMEFGEIYTARVDIENTGDKEIKIRIELFNDNNDRTSFFGTIVPIGESKKCICQFTYPNKKYNEARLCMDGNSNSNISTGLYKYKCAKIERGNKATDWTPAPEDLATAEELESTNDDLNKLDNDLSEKISKAESSISQLANSISTLVKDENGESMMKQTANGWEFSMSETIKQIEAAEKVASDAMKQLGIQESCIKAANSTLSDLIKKTAYIRSFIENGNPVTEFGNESKFKARVSNKGLELMSGTDTPAKVVTDANGKGVLEIDTATVNGEIRFGKYAIISHGNNVGFAYRG